MSNVTINGFLNFWIREHEYHSDYQKLRIIVISAFVGITFCFVFFFTYYWIDYYYGYKICVYITIGLFLLLVLNKAFGNYILSGNLFALVGALGLSGIVLTNAILPIFSSVITWLIIPPFSGFLYVGKKSGVIWSLISIIIVIGMFMISFTDWEFPNQIPAKYALVNQFSTTIGIILYLIVIVSVYEKEKNNFVNKVRKNSIEIEQQKEEILTINESLEYKNNQLEIANKNITSSIETAQRIQRAILPSDSFINKVFPEKFLIYKPKDIVSGDFYWVSQINNMKFAAVIDCTGHGVPGAFISLIAKSILDELVNTKNVYCPAEILTKFDSIVNQRIGSGEHKAENEVGMDIGICRIDLNDHQCQVSFSGAKNNLLYISNHQLKDIKGDRFSIGGLKHKPNKAFSSQSVVLNPGDAIYMTTDGYIDQANAERKRLGSKKYAHTIQKSRLLPFYEQRNVLIDELIEHQGHTSQRDDITVFAFKV